MEPVLRKYSHMFHTLLVVMYFIALHGQALTGSVWYWLLFFRPIQDLFKGYLWNRIPKGARLLPGSLFLGYVGNLAVTSGQQQYQKT